jgi:hypothetical protein
MAIPELIINSTQSKANAAKLDGHDLNNIRHALSGGVHETVMAPAL